MHKEARHQRLPNVDVVVFARELSASKRKVEAHHESCQLLQHTVARLQAARVQEVFVRPFLVLAVALHVCVSSIYVFVYVCV
jgi:hypothetical protein